jgi:hypothetical protein
MRGVLEVAAAGSAGNRGGKNFLMRGDLRVGGVAEIVRYGQGGSRVNEGGEGDSPQMPAKSEFLPVLLLMFCYWNGIFQPQIGYGEVLHS